MSNRERAAYRRLHRKMIYNIGCKQWRCLVYFFFSLTRDFVLQLHVGHFASSCHAHASRPIGSIQLPVGSPETHTGSQCDVAEQFVETDVDRGGVQGDRQESYYVSTRSVSVHSFLRVSKTSSRHFAETPGWISTSTLLLIVVNQSCVSWGSGICYCL